MPQMYLVNSEAELKTLGEQLVGSLTGGDILLLSGELGSGKTTLTKGIARGLQITNDILSPTFTLMNVYQTQHPHIKQLVHVDTYRLTSEDQLEEIGFSDYLDDPATVCVIEWPEKLLRILKNKHVINITLSHVEGGRKVVIDRE